MNTTTKIMIVAGEASGDRHAAKLVTELNALLSGEVSFFGAAGVAMRESGVEAVVESDELSIVGLTEIARALPMFLKTKKTLVAAAVERRPDVAILVDFPDFNLKLAKSLTKLGVKVVYYISPQLWAWRKYRISTVRNNVDLMLTILPFEKDWYAARGVHHVEYVGNPLAREVHPSQSRIEFAAEVRIDPTRPTIALLPGSRHKEISRILPPMLDSAAIISQKVTNAQFLVAAASAKACDNIDEMIMRHGNGSLDIRVVDGKAYDVLNASDVAAVTSGTATLETGIIGTPMAIVYKTSRLNYSLLEPLITVDHYGLINLIAGERIAKELIQDDFTPQTLADELLRLLEPATNAEVREQLKIAVEKLGHGGASRRAAGHILDIIGN